MDMDHSNKILCSLEEAFNILSSEAHSKFYFLGGFVVLATILNCMKVNFFM